MGIKYDKNNKPVGEDGKGIDYTDLPEKEGKGVELDLPVERYDANKHRDKPWKWQRVNWDELKSREVLC